MPDYSYQKIGRISAIIILILITAPFLYAAEPDFDLDVGPGSLWQQQPSKAKEDKEERLSVFQEEARLYRNQGLRFQSVGNLELAMSSYQKAVELDPDYSVAYNDLGIIYESGGALEQAEECYLKAISADPDYLNAYSNLAFLYENKRDLQKAASYWEKRAALGPPNDPWAKRAAQRAKDIRLITSDNPYRTMKEQEVVGLVKDMGAQKYLTGKDNKELAKNYFQKAQASYRKGDDIVTYKQAFNALQLDPSNTEILEFVEKLQTRLLSK